MLGIEINVPSDSILCPWHLFITVAIVLLDSENASTYTINMYVNHQLAVNSKM